MIEELKTNSLRPLSGMRSSIRFFSHVFRLITGIREGWTIGDSFCYLIITAFMIGYGDFAPNFPLTKTLVPVIGLVGFLFAGIFAAIAIESIRYTIKGETPLNTDEE